MFPLLLFSFMFVTSSYGHILKMGDCPEVEVMRNFDMDKVSNQLTLPKTFDPTTYSPLDL